MSKRGDGRPSPGIAERSPVDAADPAGRERRGSRPRTPRSSSPRPWSRPSRRSRARTRGSAGRPSSTTLGGASRDLERRPRRARPGSGRPRSATVAGTAPVSRTAFSAGRATSTFWGYGRPWLMSVDSSATTARPHASASATSGAMTMRSGVIMDLRVRRAARHVHRAVRQVHGAVRAVRRQPSRARLVAMTDRRRRTTRLPVPETLRQQVVLEEHDLAPDGSFAVISRRAVEGDDYVSHLWLVPLDGSEPRPLTTGTVRDMEPRISPDGTRVAFTHCTPDADRKDIAILDLQSGACGVARAGRAVGRRRGSSPDGRRLAFRARTGPSGSSSGRFGAWSQGRRRAPGSPGDGAGLPLGRDRLHRPASPVARGRRSRRRGPASAHGAGLAGSTRTPGGRTDGRSRSSPTLAWTPTCGRARRSGRWRSRRVGLPGSGQATDPRALAVRR